MLVIKEGQTTDRSLLDFMKNYNPRQFTCNMCQCEFIADKSEYAMITVDSGNVMLPEGYMINCPECGYKGVYNRFDTGNISLNDIAMYKSMRTKKMNNTVSQQNPQMK